MRLHEPYELQQLEERFQKLKPSAYKEEGRLYFTCVDAWYRNKIGAISEPLHYEHKVDALKLRAKLRLFYILQEEKKLKVCQCGKLLFNPKPWQDICENCIRTQRR